MSEEVTRGEINDIISGFATQNAEYREAVKQDAKAVLSKQMGRELPDWLNVKVVEESADTIYLVIPHVAEEGAELSDSGLESVAGGKGETTYTCESINGVGTHVEINAGFSF